MNTTIDNYVPSAPAITALRPKVADRRGGTPITIFGAGFAPGCRVFVDTEELIGEVIAILQSPAKNVLSALLSSKQTVAGLVKTLETRAK